MIKVCLHLSLRDSLQKVYFVFPVVVGSQFDKFGNLNNWWSKEAMDGFRNRTQCIIAQYSSYEVPFTGLKVKFSLQLIKSQSPANRPQKSYNPQGLSTKRYSSVASLMTLTPLEVDFSHSLH